jgi:hypothetical protein
MIDTANGAAEGTLANVDLRLAAEELAVLCRGREAALALLLPELAGMQVPDVVERTLVARGFLELAPGGGTALAPFVEDLVLGVCEAWSVEHVTVDELGDGPGFWMAIAHGDDVAVTITPSEVDAVYDVSVSGPYEPPPDPSGEPELETTLGRLEELLSARREATLGPDPGDRATALVLGASSYVERVRRTFGWGVLAVEHRVLLDAADLGTYDLVGLPSPVDGDAVDAGATIRWVRVPGDGR